MKWLSSRVGRTMGGVLQPIRPKVQNCRFQPATLRRNRAGALAHDLVLALMQVAEDRMEPQLEPKPRHPAESALIVAAHGSRSRDLSKVSVFTKAHEAANQLAVLS